MSELKRSGMWTNAPKTIPEETRQNVVEQVNSSVCFIAKKYGLTANDVRQVYFSRCITIGSPYRDETLESLEDDVEPQVLMEDEGEESEEEAATQPSESEDDVVDGAGLVSPLVTEKTVTVKGMKRYDLQMKLKTPTQCFLISHVVSSSEIYGYPLEDGKRKGNVDVVGKIGTYEELRKLEPMPRKDYKVGRPCVVYQYNPEVRRRLVEKQRLKDAGTWFRGRIEALEPQQVVIRLVDRGYHVQVPLPANPKKLVPEVKPLPIQLCYGPFAYSVTAVGQTLKLLSGFLDCKQTRGEIQRGKLLIGKINLSVQEKWRQDGVLDYLMYDIEDEMITRMEQNLKIPVLPLIPLDIRSRYRSQMQMPSEGNSPELDDVTRKS